MTTMILDASISRTAVRHLTVMLDH